MEQFELKRESDSNVLKEIEYILKRLKFNNNT